MGSLASKMDTNVVTSILHFFILDCLQARDLGDFMAGTLTSLLQVVSGKEICMLARGMPLCDRYSVFERKKATPRKKVDLIL